MTRYNAASSCWKAWSHWPVQRLQRFTHGGGRRANRERDLDDRSAYGNGAELHLPVPGGRGGQPTFRSGTWPPHQRASQHRGAVLDLAADLCGYGGGPPVLIQFSGDSDVNNEWEPLLSCAQPD